MILSCFSGQSVAVAWGMVEGEIDEVVSILCHQAQQQRPSLVQITPVLRSKKCEL